MKKINLLAAKAREEAPPQISLNMQMLLRAEQKGPTLFPMAWAATIASVAAALLLVLTLQLTTTTSSSTVAQVSTDPLFSAAKVEMP